MQVVELMRILVKILVKHGNTDITCLVDGYEGGLEFLTESQIKMIYFIEGEDIPGDCAGHIDEVDDFMLSHDPEVRQAKVGLVFHR